MIYSGRAHRVRTPASLPDVLPNWLFWTLPMLKRITGLPFSKRRKPQVKTIPELPSC